ncbi:chromate transporter [Bradyrhizobium sp. NAS80.1]|uniref:chromate efflux transporter n=1 Tax=Bradyrhizobium sp. NAS80.1 TaxID=1680159 RepID=UPI0009629741|nr:chromate efflux transporter [Bradyrhizobium sp. NAS80.1]OKO73588.1 chromate transporter [Bradyrhizobium sp. NAS80.1]
MDQTSVSKLSSPTVTSIAPQSPAGSPWEVLKVFLRLGLTCFGGPIAHIGYFRDEFVVRRKWIDEHAYADLVGLCQFLPGPASSQVGFSIGLMRAGYLGALAAWAGFTLPSAAILVLFAYGAGALSGPVGAGLLHGLKLTAVAIVAQAVWGMARKLCPDRERASIAVVAALIILFSTASIAQIGAIVLGGLAGLWLCRSDAPAPSGHVEMPVSQTVGLITLGMFFVLLAGLPVLRSLTGSTSIALFDAFYRSGALVFGGGHVVLPLLREAFVAPGWLSDDAFLAGYGAAQAVPGPLFTFAAYLGTVVSPEPHGLVGAALGLVGIFLPGMLVLLGTLPFWDAFRKRAGAQAMMRGVNAAVVGVLGAAMYDPVWTTTVHSPRDFGIALVGFVLLVVWRAPPLVVVAFSAAAGVVSALM